jgi:hypothetical protein
MDADEDKAASLPDVDLRTVAELLAEILEQLRMLNDSVVQLTERLAS